ncbi:hypothetical protein [Pyxidicoccus xibeiensis]|uniref:hypothetical protein n=1 Tax=Pyxidicoccus xibeiensis TaxID=2906759 RepID=UPI0020A75D10|nr:hypothetical protein [Pyxidicoccus xibeiensis]MCP3143385.1 hypothetical protein [Pyxidicoccus xibeiensis]
MADSIERPLFSEGEVLQARSLNNAVDLGRSRMARHARQQHRWGIVQGLELELKEGELTLTAGIAVDARGREIIVPRDERVPPETFGEVRQTGKWFPLFLLGVDEQLAGDAVLGRCGGTSGRRVRDTFELQFQLEREAEDWDVNEEQPLLTDGSDLPTGQGRRARVLVGFIQCGEEALFEAVKGDLDASHARRFAGPRGKAWETPDTKDPKVQVLLGANAHGQGEKDALAILVGKPEAAVRVARFDQDGNLYIRGELRPETTDVGQTPGTGVPVVGEVKVVSGTASDGVRLPLPPGVREEDVAEDKVTLHTFIRPLASVGGVIVIECRVDEERRVRCLAQELTGKRIATGEVTTLVLNAPRQWSVEYLVLARSNPPSTS